MSKQMESESLLGILFNTDRDAVAVCLIGADGKPTHFTQVNDIACKRLGYSREEMLKLSPQDIDATDRAGQMPANIEKLFNTGHVLFETEHVAKDGHRISVEVSTNLLQLNGKQAALSVARDITERRLAETHEKEFKSNLERATRMESLGVLVGGVAHDLNNVLGPILLLPDLITDYVEQHGNPDDTEHSDILEAVETIKESATRAASVVSDLVVMGRRGRILKAPLDINRLVETVLESKTVRIIKALRPDVQISGHLSDISLWCLGSESRLVRMLTNLVNNAAEAIRGPGQVVICVGKEELSEPRSGHEVISPGDYVTIEVTDSGCGMDAKTIARIFEPFFSTKSANERSGSGLGLSVVAGLVKDHEGSLDVKSIPGKGTTFTVYLPAVAAERLHEPCSKESLPGDHEAILIVDDEPGQQVSSRQQLKKLGYSAVAVSSGEEAVELFEASAREGKPAPFDLVIVDVIMRGIDGFTTCGAIRVMYPEQKLVIASGHSQDEYEDQVNIMDAKWLAKPYTAIDLARAVRSRLDT